MTCNFFLVLALLAILSTCRKFETSVKFSQLKQHNGWYYIEKFKFAQGVARFETQIYVRGKAKSKSHQIYIQGIPSEKWEAQQEKKCESTVTMPVLIQPLRMTGQKSTERFQFSVSHDNIYYFVIKDCYQLFRKDYDNQDLVLYIKFHAFNNDIELGDAPDQVNQINHSDEQIIKEESSNENENEQAPQKSVNAEEKPAEALEPIEEKKQAIEGDVEAKQIEQL